MLLGLVSDSTKALSKTHHSLIGQLNNTGITAASALKAGERVDVWTSGPRNPDTKSDNRTENGARAIVTNAEIVAITVDEGVLGANGKATVQLWVKEEALAALVKESNSDSKISLIPGTYGEGQ